MDPLEGFGGMAGRPAPQPLLPGSPIRPAPALAPGNAPGAPLMRQHGQLRNDLGLGSPGVGALSPATDGAAASPGCETACRLQEAEVGLQHLSLVSLKALAASMGLDPHRPRAELLAAIRHHLKATVPFSWSAAALPAQHLAVYGFSLVHHGGALYLYGGRCGSLDMAEQGNRDVLRYDPTAKQWAPLEVLGEVPDARRWHSAVVWRDSMYVFGGQVWGGTEWEATRSMVCFDLWDRRWSEVQQQGMLPGPRYRHSCCVLGQHMYMLPGQEGEGPRASAICCCNLETATWTVKACAGDMPPMRDVEALVAWQEQLYALVAVEERGQEGMQVYQLDVRPGHGCRWQCVQARAARPLPQARRQCCAVLADNTLILSGGVIQNGDSRYVLSDLWAFDLVACSWGSIEVPQALQQQAARASHSAACIAGSAYIIGGWHQAWPAPSCGFAVSKCYVGHHALVQHRQQPLGAAAGAHRGDGPAAGAAAAAPEGAQAELGAAGNEGGLAPPCSVINTELLPSLAGCRPSVGDSAPYSDVLVVAGDGAKFPAHRVVLACQSSVLARAFSAGMAEEATGQLVLSDTPGPVVGALLAYLYGALGAVPPGLAQELFTTADRYDLPGLRAECVLAMRSSLSEASVAAVAALAALHGLAQLWDDCVAYASEPQRQARVLSSREYADLWRTDSATAAQFTAQVTARSAAMYTALQDAREGQAAKRQRRQ